MSKLDVVMSRRPTLTSGAMVRPDKQTAPIRNLITKKNNHRLCLFKLFPFSGRKILLVEKGSASSRPNHQLIWIDNKLSHSLAIFKSEYFFDQTSNS